MFLIKNLPWNFSRHELKYHLISYLRNIAICGQNMYLSYSCTDIPVPTVFYISVWLVESDLGLSIPLCMGRRHRSYRTSPLLSWHLFIQHALGLWNFDDENLASSSSLSPDRVLLQSASTGVRYNTPCLLIPSQCKKKKCISSICIRTPIFHGSTFASN